MDALSQLVTKSRNKPKLAVIVLFWIAILGFASQTGMAFGNENNQIVTMNINSPETSLRGIEFTSKNWLDVSDPDAYGYQWDNSVSYSWKDTSGAELVTLSDPDYGFAGPIEIGFEIPFYENTYSQIHVSANGFLSFYPLIGTTGYDFNREILSDIAPNNIIAAFWNDLAVGGSYNSGKISTMGGSDGNGQYFAVNYEGVSKRSSPTDLLTFQVILYENGDIWVQYNLLNGDISATVGLEDSDGVVGLPYLPILQNGSAIRFQRPPAEARVKVLSPFQSGVTQDGVRNFLLDIRNTGELGSDTYNLTTFLENSGNPGWVITLWQENGSIGLTDTNGDFIIDTGAISQGETKTILVRLQSPPAKIVGDNASFRVIATSVLDSNKLSNARFQVAIPAGHFLAFGNSAGLDLGRITPAGQTFFDVTEFGESPSLILVEDHYFYAWEDADFNEGIDIEYAVLAYSGQALQPATKLTNNATAEFSTRDFSPALAVSPDQRIGVVWVRRMIDDPLPQFRGENYNVYFAILDTNGNVLTEPINITNNGPCDANPTICWANGANEDVPVYSSPVILATSDNRFIISWIDTRILGGEYVTDLGYVAYTTDGDPLMLSPDDLKNGNTGGDLYSEPRLIELSNSRLLITYDVQDPLTQTYTPAFEVYELVPGNQTIGINLQPDVLLTGANGINADSGALTDSTVLIAWTNTETDQINYAILSDDGAEVTFDNQIIELPNPDDRHSRSVSVTANSDGQGILSWGDAEVGNHVYYALIDSTGTILTPAIIAWIDNEPITISRTGQGIAPIPDWRVLLPIINR